ncbi:hypothetical protein Nepgr_031579 [Nepenthes gracilis]|uniref:Uncharacterized protein n=1 Tax=Nepenthes gracilis TaxID=150966 RepID=A0AAD3TIS2_NEPGR|nr:hypothetical protein Nepgr_031579 [Nepenthes gracilis]
MGQVVMLVLGQSSNGYNLLDGTWNGTEQCKRYLLCSLTNSSFPLYPVVPPSLSQFPASTSLASAEDQRVVKFKMVYRSIKSLYEICGVRILFDPRDFACDVVVSGLQI